MAIDPWREPRQDLEPETPGVERNFSVVRDETGIGQEQVLDADLAEIHPLLEAAFMVEIELGEPRTQKCPADGDDYEYNVTLRSRNGGEPFGAAAVFYTESLNTHAGGRINAVEIEVFHVDDENRGAAYLALLLDLIKTDPNLRTIYGPADDMATGENMVRLADDINPFLLDLGWQIKYKLSRHEWPHGRENHTIETFDPDDLHNLDPEVSVTHSFQKTSAPKELSPS